MVKTLSLWIDTYKSEKNVPCQDEESLLDAFVNLRRCLHEFDAQFLGKLTTLLLSNSLLVCPIRFIAYEYLVDSLRSMLLYVLMPSSDVY